MRTLLPLLIAALLALTVGGTKKANSSTMELQYPNDTLTRIEINKPQRYLLLPIEERQPEVRVRLVGDRPEDTWLDVRLAVDYRLLRTSTATHRQVYGDSRDRGT